MSKPIKEIKNRIKETLDYRGVTQQELCDKTGIPKSSLSQYISGYAKPKQDRISLISTALDVDPAWLMGFDVPMTASAPLYEVAAGEGRYSDGYPVGDFHIALKEEQFVAEVKGMSMQPNIQPGDIAVITRQNVPDYDGQICLVKINGDEATLKHVKKMSNGLLLIGDNPSDYEPHFYTAEEVMSMPVTIEGVLVTILRNF